jgi:hypothetical protein
LTQPRQEAGDPQIGAACLVLLAVRAGDGQRDLSGMLGLPGDRLHQQWSAGDRLGPVIQICQTDEQTPPVEHQRDAAREQPAPLQIVHREAAPVGNKVLQNVTGSIAPVSGELLLGQSFLRRFRSWSIDSGRGVLVLE